MKKIFLPFSVAFLVCTLYGENLKGKRLYTENYYECIKNSFSTADTIECMKKEFKIQDKKLNREYKRIIKSLSPERKKKLRDIQRAWINYVNKKCSFFYHPQSGSGGLIDMQECFLEETAERANELSKLY